MILRQIIEHLFDRKDGSYDLDDAQQAVDQLKAALNRGEIRAAHVVDGTWSVQPWVKKGILLAFRIGVLEDQSANDFPFFDKDTMSLKAFAPATNVRIVPGGTSVRDGAFVAPGVIIMPPSYINIGAYVDEGTMVDSHALIGSCAQIGKKVHVSAGTQIGGVLEPIGSLPVIVEDDVFIGGNCGVYEGALIRRRAVLGAGVILTGSTAVYDIPNGKIYRRSGDQPLTIPEGAVVVAGSRGINHPFAAEHRLSHYTPIIIKYRDGKTDASAVLEESLR
jgi:2,3,4,5-tetrahydropyridine-2-carboxylate N-succinyltransferase